MHAHEGVFRPRAPLQGEFLGWYRDLLAIETVASLNAGFCDYHTSHCPPSQQLVSVCREVGAHAAGTALSAGLGGPGGTVRADRGRGPLGLLEAAAADQTDVQAGGGGYVGLVLQVGVYTA